MSTPPERQEQLLAWLRSEGTVRIAELANRLGVSQMTAHRDITVLAEKGLVDRLHGAVRLAGHTSITLQVCSACGAPATERLRFMWTSESSGRAHACCGHCALILLGKAPAPRDLITTDFLYGRVLVATQAFYVIESRVTACCSPSILPFLSLEDAQDFSTAFGGTVMTWPELVTSSSTF